MGYYVNMGNNENSDFIKKTENDVGITGKILKTDTKIVICQ